MVAPQGGVRKAVSPGSPAGSRNTLRLREGKAKAVEDNLQAEEEHKPSVLQLPWQAGLGVWMDGALECRRTDGTLLPSSHRDLQRLPPLLAGCQWLYEAKRSSALVGRYFYAGDIQIWGQETQVDKQRCTGGNHAICWGSLSLLLGTPWGSTALDSLQGKIGSSLVMSHKQAGEQSPSMGGRHLPLWAM